MGTRLIIVLRITFRIDRQGIEKTFGISVDTLMRMQNSYYYARVRKKEKQIKAKAFAPRTEVAGGGIDCSGNVIPLR
jgi:hypothetical protein